MKHRQSLWLHASCSFLSGDRNCSNSSLGTSSCSFLSAEFCGGVDNGFDCDYPWVVTKSETGQISGGVVAGKQRASNKPLVLRKEAVEQ